MGERYNKEQGFYELNGPLLLEGSKEPLGGINPDLALQVAKGVDKAALIAQQAAPYERGADAAVLNRDLYALVHPTYNQPPPAMRVVTSEGGSGGGSGAPPGGMMGGQAGAMVGPTPIGAQPDVRRQAETAWNDSGISAVTSSLATAGLGGMRVVGAGQVGTTLLRSSSQSVPRGELSPSAQRLATIGLGGMGGVGRPQSRAGQAIGSLDERRRIDRLSVLGLEREVSGAVAALAKSGVRPVLPGQLGRDQFGIGLGSIAPAGGSGWNELDENAGTPQSGTKGSEWRIPVSTRERPSANRNNSGSALSVAATNRRGSVSMLENPREVRIWPSPPDIWTDSFAVLSSALSAARTQRDVVEALATGNSTQSLFQALVVIDEEIGELKNELRRRENEWAEQVRVKKEKYAYGLDAVPKATPNPEDFGGAPTPTTYDLQMLRSLGGLGVQDARGASKQMRRHLPNKAVNPSDWDTAFSADSGLRFWMFDLLDPTVGTQ